MSTRYSSLRVALQSKTVPPRLEPTVKAQPLSKLACAWFQLLSVGRHEHIEAVGRHTRRGIASKPGEHSGENNTRTRGNGIVTLIYSRSRIIIPCRPPRRCSSCGPAARAWGVCATKQFQVRQYRGDERHAIRTAPLRAAAGKAYKLQYKCALWLNAADNTKRGPPVVGADVQHFLQSKKNGRKCDYKT